MRKVILFVAANVLIAGCDVESQLERAQVQQQKAAKQAEQEQAMTKELSVSIEQYLKGKLQLTESACQAAQKKELEIRSDSSELEKILATELASGKSEDPAAKALAVLRNETVNALAVKYLSAGFQIQSEELIARVKDHRARRHAYETATHENNDTFSSMMKDTEGWSKMTKGQRETEMRRLQREIEDLERKLKSIRKGLIGTYSVERERRARENDCEEQIYKKRQQLDWLRNPTSHRKIETRALSDKERAWEYATHARNRNQREIDHLMKPKENEAEIVKIIQQETIGKLQQALQKALAASVAQAAKESERIRVLKELILAVPISTASELRNLKVRADNLR